MFELVKGSPKYRRYLPATLYTTIWNLVELYAVVRRHFDQEQARRQFARFRSLAVDTPDDLLREAMELKAAQAGLSYADAIGYTAARRLGARFLTGDPAFRKMPDVEFRP